MDKFHRNENAKCHLKGFFNLYSFIVCDYVYMQQQAGLSSLPPCGSRGWDSGHQTWEPVPLPAVPSPTPRY